MELEHELHFAWEQRKERLLDVIRDMDSDLPLVSRHFDRLLRLSLVECDHYEAPFDAENDLTYININIIIK